MKRRFSEASLSGRKVELWTPWGILRLDERETNERSKRWRRPALWVPPAVATPARKRDNEPLV